MLIGPTIAATSYEVDHTFYQSIRRQLGRLVEPFFSPSDRTNHYLFDLPGMIRYRLESLPLASIEDIQQDTYSQPNTFFSYRRTTHKKESDYGRQLSIIMLTKNP